MATIIDTLITDRTQADVDRVRYLALRIRSGAATPEEMAEFSRDLKGSYNASDLNRVGQAMRYLVQRVNDLGAWVQAQPRVDWPEGLYWPLREEMEYYRSSVFAIRSALPLAASVPAVPGSMSNLTYEEANAIEAILVAVERACEGILASLHRCGAFTMVCGGFFLPSEPLSYLDDAYAQFVTSDDEDFYTSDGEPFTVEIME